MCLNEPMSCSTQHDEKNLELGNSVGALSLNLGNTDPKGLQEVASSLVYFFYFWKMGAGIQLSLIQEDTLLI